MNAPAGDTAQIGLCNLSESPLDYEISLANPPKDPLRGDLPPRSYGTFVVPFAPVYYVSAAGDTVQLAPAGLAVYVPEGISGLVRTNVFSAPSPPPS